MPTLILAGEVFDLPPFLTLDEAYPPDVATFLTSLYAIRMRYRISVWLTKNPEASHSASQSAALDLARDFIFGDAPDVDLLEIEAAEIARERIIARLAAEGLPPPRSLAEHCAQLASDPAILAEARRRLEARATATREILQGL